MNNINILYKINKEIVGNTFEIVSVYDSHTFIDLDQNEKKFSGLEQLEQFAKDLIDELKSRNTYILSVEEFNTGIANSVKTKKDFSEIFEKYGTMIKSDTRRGGKGIFDKIFS